jgi:hypothetical protein
MSQSEDVLISTAQATGQAANILMNPSFTDLQTDSALNEITSIVEAYCRLLESDNNHPWSVVISDCNIALAHVRDILNTIDITMGLAGFIAKANVTRDIGRLTCVLNSLDDESMRSLFVSHTDSIVSTAVRRGYLLPMSNRLQVTSYIGHIIGFWMAVSQIEMADSILGTRFRLMKGAIKDLQYNSPMPF